MTKPQEGESEHGKNNIKQSTKTLHQMFVTSLEVDTRRGHDKSIRLMSHIHLGKSLWKMFGENQTSKKGGRPDKSSFCRIQSGQTIIFILKPNQISNRRMLPNGTKPGTLQPDRSTKLLPKPDGSREKPLVPSFLSLYCRSDKTAAAATTLATASCFCHNKIFL